MPTWHLVVLGHRPLQEILLSEYYSQRMDVDPTGLVGDPAFWSGADAALRLRTLPQADLALRELEVLATRRSTGLNAPKPWAAMPELSELSLSWEEEASDIHFSQRSPPDDSASPPSLWAHSGMGPAGDSRCRRLLHPG